MDSDTNQSEIIRICKQIEVEHRAAEFALYGFCLTSKHKFITARMVRMGELQGELASIIGEEESVIILIKIMDGKETKK